MQVILFTQNSALNNIWRSYFTGNSDVKFIHNRKEFFSHINDDVDIIGIHVTSQAQLHDQLLQEGVTERLLKLKIRLTPMHLLGNIVERNVGIKVSQDLLELRFGQQSVVDRGQLLGLKGPDAIKF